ncbi:MAG: YceI family protein [Methylophilaceae bacterium]
MNVKLIALLSGLLLSSVAFAEVEMYKIDNTHSFANWSIRHVASKTSGTFSDVTGKLLIDRKDLAKSSIEAKIKVLSVNSSHAKRDAHIKKEKYLDAAKYNVMTFVSTKIEASNRAEGVVIGDFTMHGVTKEISFPFKVLGFGKDPFGGYRTGLEAHTTIKASDYGFNWAKKSGASVGDNVEITLLIEGVRYYADHKPLSQ